MVHHHNSLTVRSSLNEHFLMRWLCRRGAVEWPSRCPDLTPPDFFIWGYLKKIVHTTKQSNIPDLKQEIRHGVQVTNNTDCLLTKLMLSFRHRLSVCQQSHGSHIEHLKSCRLTDSHLYSVLNSFTFDLELKDGCWKIFCFFSWYFYMEILLIYTTYILLIHMPCWILRIINNNRMSWSFIWYIVLP